MGKGSRVRGTSEMDSTDVGDDFIDDTMSEISQESTESMPIPSRPKAVHKRRRKVTSSSELPADDIRLTYPKQYFAALNSGDASTIAEMLNNIAIPNVVLVSKKLTYSTEHHLPNYLEVSVNLLQDIFYFYNCRLLVLMPSPQFARPSSWPLLM